VIASVCTNLAGQLSSTHNLTLVMTHISILWISRRTNY